jgi:hypothetical protein
MKLSHMIAAMAAAMLFSFAGGMEFANARHDAAANSLEAQTDQRIRDITAHLAAKFDGEVAEYQKQNNAFRLRAEACDTAAKHSSNDDAFEAQQYTLLYEPGLPAGVSDAPGYELLDALRPGLGKALSRMQGSTAAASSEGNGFGNLRWVLYRKPPERFFRALLQPAGGHIAVGYSLPVLTKEALEVAQ